MSRESDKKYEIINPEATLDSATDGWDPYIFAMVDRNRAAFAEERRRKPRHRGSGSRRATLAAQSPEPADD